MSFLQEKLKTIIYFEYFLKACKKVSSLKHRGSIEKMIAWSFVFGKSLLRTQHWVFGAYVFFFGSDPRSAEKAKNFLNN